MQHRHHQQQRERGDPCDVLSMSAAEFQITEHLRLLQQFISVSAGVTAFRIGGHETQQRHAARQGAGIFAVRHHVICEPRRRRDAGGRTRRRRDVDVGFAIGRSSLGRQAPRCSATVVPVASGASTMDLGAAGLLASIGSGPASVRSHMMDMAATPAAMLAPATGRANRAQRALAVDRGGSDNGRVRGRGGGVYSAVTVSGVLGDLRLNSPGDAVVQGHAPLGAQRGADHGKTRPLGPQCFVASEPACEQFAFGARQFAIEHRRQLAVAFLSFIPFPLCGPGRLQILRAGACRWPRALEKFGSEPCPRDIPWRPRSLRNSAHRARAARWPSSVLQAIASIAEFTICRISSVSAMPSGVSGS